MRSQAIAWWAAQPRWLRGVLAAVLLLAALVVAVPLLATPAIGLMARAVDVEPATGDLDEQALEQRSVVRDADGEEFAVLHDEIDRRIIGLDDIPEHVQHAVLAAEDRRFYEHDGYDAWAIGRAAVANLQAGAVTQGASTITQQVAQHAFLDREETITRKAQEIAHAVALEDELAKDEILERYLNEVYFGSGAYGVAAAAEQYFRASVDELTIDEAALLAGIIRAPERLNPREQPEQAEARRDQVLAGMVETGTISREEALSAQQEPVDVEPRLEREPDEPYALEAVKREIAGLDALGDDADERIQQLYSGGLEVHTTLDRELQHLADEIITEAFANGDGPTGALVSIDPRNEAIRALHGGVDFDELQFDLATQGRRQPGSALKPLVAAAALEEGLSPETAFQGDGPLAFDFDETSDPWEVGNFGGIDHGRIGLREATAQSVNTAYAQLALAVGIEETIEVADRLGIDAEEAFGPEDSWGPSISLGGLTGGVTPLELASAYGTFADQGRRGAPYLVDRIEDADGEVLYERDPDDREQVLDPGTNAVMVGLLQAVVEEGTASAIDLGAWEVLGKTGTTDDHTDAWFVGATATLSTTVWVGHPEDQVPMGDMTGGELPAQLWQAFTARALEGQDPTPFPDSDDPADPPEPDSETVPDLIGSTAEEALVEAADAGLIAVFPEGQAPAGERLVRHQEPAPDAELETGEAIELRFSEPAPEPAPQAEPEPDDPAEPDQPGESDDAAEEPDDEGDEDDESEDDADGDDGGGGDGDGDGGDGDGDGDGGDGDGDGGDGDSDDSDGDDD